MNSTNYQYWEDKIWTVVTINTGGKIWTVLTFNTTGAKSEEY